MRIRCGRRPVLHPARSDDLGSTDDISDAISLEYPALGPVASGNGTGRRPQIGYGRITGKAG